MSIHRKAYTPFRGEVTPRGSRSLVIARRELRLAMGRSWVRRLLAVSFLPLLGCIIFLYVRLVVEQATALTIWDGFLFETLYRVQSLFVMLLMAVVGADLIAKDTAARAHSLYFSRPLAVGDYVRGKLLSVAALLAVVIVVPGLLLDIAQLLLSREADVGAFVRSLLGVLIYGAIVAGVGSAIIGWLSSLGQRARWVGIGWVAAWLLTDGMSQALQAILGEGGGARLLSIPALFVDTARFLLAPTDEGPAALVLLVGAGALCWWLLHRRMVVLERREG